MSELDFKLAHALNSVIGWIELGNLAEARAELEAIPAGEKQRSEVLELSWLLHANAGDWVAGLKVAEMLVSLAPNESSGWLHRAYAARRVAGGGVKQAAELLRPAAVRFPEEPTIAYNLACYACQLGDLLEAREWLSDAVKRGTRAKIKAMALVDDDLKQLWPEIRKW